MPTPQPTPAPKPAKPNGAAAPAHTGGEFFPALALARIKPSVTNPRQHFDAQAMARLTASVRSKGVLQPVIVRPHPIGLDEFELVVGERRRRAAIAAGLDSIPARLHAYTDTEVLEIQLIENDQREDVHPLEEAEGYQRLLKSLKADGSPYTPEDIMARIDRGRTYVYNRLKLLDLCDEARSAFFDHGLDDAKGIDQSRAQMLARLGHHDTQRAALKDLLKTNHNGDFALSTRDARQHLERNYMLSLKDAVFDIKVTDYAIKGKAVAGACGPCPKRSGNNPDLFGDVKGADVCTDVKCFHAKRSAHFEREAEAFTAKGLTVITGNDARKILPDRYSPHAAKGEYVGAQQYCNEAGKDYGKLIGKQIAPVMVRHPDRDEFIKVFPLAQVKAVLKAQDIKTPAPANKLQGSMQQAAAKAHAKEDLDDRVRSEAYLAVRGHIAEGLSEPEWRRLAQMTVNAALDANDAPDMIVDLYLPPNADYSNWPKLRSGLDQAIAAMPVLAIPRFLFDCAHEPIINGGYGTPDDFKALDALFSRYGIDQKAIRARLVKEDKAKAATAAAIKAPTPPAKGVRT
ncbi:MAG: ParB/RepB/Spo0J family partition protein [Betaproteobacteria bacterium]